MMIHLPVVNVNKLTQRIKHAALGMFNLNDSKWGREGDKPTQEGADLPPVPPSSSDSQDRPNYQAPQGNKRPNDGPPDLDELWRDFNQKLGGIFGGASNKGRPNPNQGGNNGGGNGNGGGGFQPNMQSAGKGAVLVAAIAGIIWLGTGFFIVQEGQQAVITQFGKYQNSVGAGFNWRLPYPIQRHELVYVTQIQSVDIGRDTIVKATGLRESAMLTLDENILEIKFAVQYRLNDARAYLFESKDPKSAVVQAAETAVRDVVGKMRMDAALSEERDQIAPRVRVLMQVILDRYKVGVEVVGINLQQGGVRPPEQVQAAFDDVLKAGQERERLKNEAEAYANDVVPRAVGSASRLKEESDAYKSKIVAQAQGDSQRFRSIQAEYAKAPQVTRDRLYLDAMQEIYSKVTKVVVDSKQGNNMLYLPLDKIMQMSGQASGQTNPTETVITYSASGSTSATGTDPRSKEATTRTRERDTR